MINRQVNKRNINKTSQQLISILLFLMNVCFLSPTYAETWPSTQFKIIEYSPPSRLDSTFIDTLYDILHNKQSSSLEERFLGSIDINLARKLENNKKQ